MSISVCVCVSVSVSVERFTSESQNAPSRKPVAATLEPNARTQKTPLPQIATHAPTESATGQPRTDYSSRSPLQSSPSRPKLRCLQIRVCHKTHNPAGGRPHHDVMLSPLPPRLPPPQAQTPLVVSIILGASHTDVYPELLQDSMKPGDGIQNGAPHCRGCIALRFGPVVEFRDMTFLQQDRSLLSGSRSPILAPKRVV